MESRMLGNLHVGSGRGMEKLVSVRGYGASSLLHGMAPPPALFERVGVASGMKGQRLTRIFVGGRGVDGRREAEASPTRPAF